MKPSETIRPIGGYFELEDLGNGGNYPQAEGLQLNTGRNALEYILASIGNVSKVYIPFYTCEVILEPFKKLGIIFNFYRINERLEIADNIPLQQNMYILYTNYFGIKDAYVQKLAKKYGDSLIVDCAQALYVKHIPGIKTIYSPRKYVGIPDGAVAYIDKGINPLSYAVDESEDRMSHLIIRKEQGAQAGYAAFKENSKKLKMQDIKLMSLKTSGMLLQIDFNDIKEQRRKNFQQLHNALASSNRLVDSLTCCLVDSECPMIYPYWTTDKDLRSRLIKEQVFVATYWPNVLEWTRPDMIEYEFANNLLAIPLDQRYGEEDMNRIINLIIQ